MIRLRAVILPELGHLPAIRVDHPTLDRYVKKRLSAGIKRTTVRRELTDIHAILNWGDRRNMIAFNPAEKYERPKSDDAVSIPPTRAEIKSLIAHAVPHLQRAICLSYFTGLRPGRAELLRLTWNDVDFQMGTLTVLSAKKGGIRYRVVPLHPELVDLLHRWNEADNFDHGPIVRFRGKKIARIKSAFHTAKRAAGITRRLRLYDLRHAFVTELLRQGADVKAVSETVGHSRPDTTIRIYQHTDSVMHRTAVDLLPRLDLDCCDAGKDR